MRFVKEIAKNGEDTLIVNGRYIYSKYQPIKEAHKWIEKEFKETATDYFLVGLGLGYHLEKLVQLAPTKKIQVLKLPEENQDSVIWSNVKVIDDITQLKINSTTQVMIPQPWLHAFNMENTVFQILDEIKRKQVSFKRSEAKMAKNFKMNILQNAKYINEFTMDNSYDIACLIASGPSLNETVHWLKEIQEKVFILSVGSAFKGLLKNGVIPDAVIITDCQDRIAEQFEGINYQGPLFFLATANANVVSSYKGQKILLLQNGYEQSERLANEVSSPLLETGGSVATMAYSALCYLKFKKIILFGQDLTISNVSTHAADSTSNRTLSQNESKIEVMCNNGQIGYTLPNLYSYMFWFNHFIQKYGIATYNTAFNGAKLNGAATLNYDELKNLIY